MYRALVLPVLLACLSLFFCLSCARTDEAVNSDLIMPLRTVIDINIGEVREVVLSSGEKVNVELLSLSRRVDSLCSAVRSAGALVVVEGDTVALDVANYSLPVVCSRVRIDCPVTKDFYRKSLKDWWALESDARLRFWPVDGPLITEGTFAYPVDQRWFASKTQMCSEPTYVDGGENPCLDDFMYHAPLDFGGAEGLDRALSAVDGLVIMAGDSTLPDYEDLPFEAGYDNVVILDKRGWYHRYWHLHSIEPEIVPGAEVAMSQPVGLLGKEGCSGGWAHIHYEIVSRQPSGKWANEDGYAYIWQAYIDQYQPPLIAVARPHIIAAVGDTVALDGGRSWSRNGDELEYRWLLSDGTVGLGCRQQRSYETPGNYQEILEVTDSRGNRAFDFQDVEIFDSARPDQLPLSIHAAYHPTFGIAPGDTVTFLVRSFNTEKGSEVWDFGDGSLEVTVHSHESFGWRYERFVSRGMTSGDRERHPDGYSRTTHCFSHPGDYLVKVKRTGDFGYTGVAHLHVRVEAR